MGCLVPGCEVAVSGSVSVETVQAQLLFLFMAWQLIGLLGSAQVRLWVCIPGMYRCFK